MGKGINPAKGRHSRSTETARKRNAQRQASAGGWKRNFGLTKGGFVREGSTIGQGASIGNYRKSSKFSKGEGGPTREFAKCRKIKLKHPRRRKTVDRLSKLDRTRMVATSQDQLGKKKGSLQC